MPTCCDDLSLGGKHLRCCTDDHSWRYSVHDIWIARLADAANKPALDANIALHWDE